MTIFKPLLQKLHYLKHQQLRVVYRACRIAKVAHEGQKRDSGEDYITHPILVAIILASMYLDHESIAAALLHDVVEDTTLTKDFIKEKFGTSVADLVDGVTKLTQIESSNKAEAQADSFRKMLLAMSRDIRVIIVKLADRLHNMRTLGGVIPSKRKRIARETLDIYAPIANRLGMYEISVELESLAFVYLYPRRHKILKAAIEKIRGNRQEIMESIEKELHQTLRERGLEKVKIVGREKHLYSVYKKMQVRHVPFEEIMDVYGFRIVVNNIDDCYHVLGIVHGIYKPIPGKFKDYIAIPKFNGYQSLHTTLCGPYGIPLEIQIRTAAMDQMASGGIAAHWFYKTADNKLIDSAHIRAQQWINKLLEIQKHTGSSLEFVENVKIDLFPNEIYVFTPKGHIMELPRGATVVDFAYAVHTDVGDSCVAARVDRQFVPLSTILASGQTVSIVSTPGAKPNPAWLNFVITSKARSSIRGLLKSQKRSEVILLGKELLGKALAELAITFQQIPPQILDKTLRAINLQTIEDLYESIGLGDRLAIFIAHQIANLMQSKTPAMEERKSWAEVRRERSANPLLIKNAEGVAITFAPCCNPIPGDAIVGYFNVGHGLEVHTEDCAELAKMRSHVHADTDRYMPVKWADDVKGEFCAAVSVEMVNQRGALAQLTHAISNAGSSIEDIGMSECNGGYCLVSLKLMMSNTQHLEEILHAISLLPIAMGVIRKK